MLIKIIQWIDFFLIVATLAYDFFLSLFQAIYGFFLAYSNFQYHYFWDLKKKEALYLGLFKGKWNWESG